MSQLTSTESMAKDLLATIERQRRIICNLLISNEQLRTRLMHAESIADEAQRRESMRRRVEPGTQNVRSRQVHIYGGNDNQSAHSAA